MGQHHFLNAVNLLEQIVNAAPVPACFHYRFAWTFQARKKLSETSSLIAVNPSPPQLPASLIYCNKHTIALVDINSNIVHEQQSPFGLALPQPNTRPKLLSCYLTPSFRVALQILRVRHPHQLGQRPKTLSWLWNTTRPLL